MKRQSKEPEPSIELRTETIFFRVRRSEYTAIATEARARNMLLSEWCRRVIQQKLGIEESV